MRTCLGCRLADDKAALVRLAVTDGRVTLDPKARLGGRGGYLHRRRECLERFLKARDVEFRSLRRRIEPGARLEVLNFMKGLAPEAGPE